MALVRAAVRLLVYVVSCRFLELINMKKLAFLFVTPIARSILLGLFELIFYSTTARLEERIS